MTSSNDLFILIKSLDKAEKRYFQLASSVHKGEKDYLKLFNAIEAQEIYDEQQIKIQLKGEALLGRLPVLKNYLYALIIKTLGNFHTNSSPEFIVNDQIKYIEILLRKDQYQQAFKILKKAKKAAYKYELFHYLISLLFVEERLNSVAGYSRQNEKGILKTKKEQEAILEIYKNFNDYKYLVTSISNIHHRHSSMQNKTSVREMQNIMQSPLLKGERNALSIGARFAYCHIWRSYYGFMEQWEKSYLYAKKAVELMRSNKEVRSINFQRYLVFLFNLGVVTQKLKRFGEARAILDELRSFYRDPVFTEVPRARLFTLLVEQEIGFVIKSGNVQKGPALVREIEIDFKKLKDKLPLVGQCNILYDVAQLYFYNGNFKLALAWVNRILNDSSYKQFQYLYSNANVLNLLLHFELKDFDLLPYAANTTYRVLSKREGAFKFEKAILHFLKKFPEGPMRRSSDLTPEFIKLKSAIEKITIDPGEKKALENFFDIISWLKSKIENRSFAEIVREKAK